VVPAWIGGAFEALPRGHRVPCFRRIRLTFRAALGRATGPGGMEEGCSEKCPVLQGDRQFESLFLQRRVISTSRSYFVKTQ
jgi:hypothetical protein